MRGAPLVACALTAAVGSASATWRGALPARRPAPVAVDHVVLLKPARAPGVAPWAVTALAELVAMDLRASPALEVVVADVVDAAGGAPVPGDVVVTLRASGSAERLGVDADVQDRRGRRAPRGRAADAPPVTVPRVEGPDSEVADVAGRTAAAIRARLGLPPVAPPAPPVRPGALQAYAEGVAALRAFDAVEARARLEHAARLDPASAVVQTALADASFALGYVSRAREAARAAFERSTGRPALERLAAEGRYRELSGDWERALSVREALARLVPASLDHALALGEAQLSAGHPADALATSARVRTAVPGGAEDARVDLLEARAAAAAGDMARYAAAAARAVARGASSRRPLLEAQGLLLRADADRRSGALPRALASCVQAESLYARAGDRAGAARARATLATVHWYAGRMDEARRAAEEATRAAREIGDRDTLARALNTLAGLQSGEGRLEEARRAYVEAMAASVEVGDRDREAVAANNIGIALWRQGDLLRAREALSESVAIARAIGSERRECFARYYLGEVELEAGRPGEAAARFEDVLQRARRLSLPWLEADALGALARTRFEQDRAAEAQTLARQSLSRRAGSDRTWDMYTLLALARLAASDGRLAEAEAHARDAAELPEVQRVPLREAAARTVLGWVRNQRGDLQGARAAVARARTLLASSDALPARLAAEIEAARGELLRGERAAAAAALAQATHRARRAGLGVLELEAELLRLRADATDGGPGDPARLGEIAARAEAAGLHRIARLARAGAGPSAALD